MYEDNKKCTIKAVSIVTMYKQKVFAVAVDILPIH